MTMKHRCKDLPRTSQIEYDWQWKWCWTTKDVMETIEFCPYCGAKLAEPTVTHIEMLCNLVDVRGAPILVKGNTYEVNRTTDDTYEVYDEYHGICVVPKNQRGILYKCKEVL